MEKEQGRPLHLRLDDGGPFVIWGDGEQVKPRHGVVVWTLICDNPQCKCREAHIRVRVVDEQIKDMRGEATERTFSHAEEAAVDLAIPEKRPFALLDVDTGEVSLAEGVSENECNIELFGLLKEKMKGDMLERVRRRWRAVKQIDREQWPRGIPRSG